MCSTFVQLIFQEVSTTNQILCFPSTNSLAMDCWSCMWGSLNIFMISYPLKLHVSYTMSFVCCSYPYFKASKLSVPHGNSVDHPICVPPHHVCCHFGCIHLCYSAYRVQVWWTQRPLAGNTCLGLFYWYTTLYFQTKLSFVQYMSFINKTLLFISNEEVVCSSIQIQSTCSWVWMTRGPSEWDVIKWSPIKYLSRIRIS